MPLGQAQMYLYNTQRHQHPLGQAQMHLYNTQSHQHPLGQAHMYLYNIQRHQHATKAGTDVFIQYPAPSTCH